jgi:Fic family protein/DNA-binding HxlR family transcriptional regulator
MPLQVPDTELDELVARIKRSADGTSVSELQPAYPEMSRRTLQRRLSVLVQAGRLEMVGKGPAARYTLPREGSAAVSAVAEIEEPDLLPLSSDGQEVRRLVHRPIHERTPVGYRRELLAEYEPNVTLYLPDDLRQRLYTRGRSPAGDRPAGTYARQILDRLLIDLSWASSRLEGNTYTRLDTHNLIAFGREAEGKDSVETQMILNHKQAIEMLVEEAETVGFNRYTFQNLHALLADNLLREPGAAGRLRVIEVGISGTVFQPLAIPQQIDELFGEILEKADAIQDPFEQAFFIMVHLPYLQPFEDVNKRVSRLGANIPLIRGNLAPLSFVDVPEREYISGTLGVYELNRVELLRDVFAWAYERSCQRYTAIKDSLPEPDPLRLRNRDALTEVVSGVVRDMAEIDTRVIRRLAEPRVDADDMDDFVALAVNELYQLHEGNLARFRLRPSEFERWRAVREALST